MSAGASVIRSGFATKRGAIKKNWKRRCVWRRRLGVCVRLLWSLLLTCQTRLASRFFILRSDLTLSYYKDAAAKGRPQVRSPMCSAASTANSHSPLHPAQGVIDLNGAVTFNHGQDCDVLLEWPSQAPVASPLVRICIDPQPQLIDWAFFAIHPSIPQDTRLEIVTLERTFYVYAESAEAASSWVNTLRQSTGQQPPKPTATLDLEPDVSAAAAKKKLTPEQRQHNQEAIKRLAAEEGNKHCFDCGGKGELGRGRGVGGGWRADDSALNKPPIRSCLRRGDVGRVEYRRVSVHALRRHPQGPWQSYQQG